MNPGTVIQSLELLDVVVGILAANGVISEIISLIPTVKANGTLQAVTNLMKALFVKEKKSLNI